MSSEADCDVRIVRRGGYADRLRAYRILANGRPAGTVAAHSILDLKVPSGPATIEARIDWGRSKPLAITATPDRPTEIEVANRWGALLALWGLTFGFRTYLTLRRIG